MQEQATVLVYGCTAATQLADEPLTVTQSLPALSSASP